jgi:hypothetical protein
MGDDARNPRGALLFRHVAADLTDGNGYAGRRLESAPKAHRAAFDQQDRPPTGLLGGNPRFLASLLAPN